MNPPIKHTDRARAAFTLVELLVVICIIAILMAIGFGVWGSMRKRSAEVSCTSNMRQVWTYLHGYAMENDGYLPAANAIDPVTSVQYSWWLVLGQKSNPNYNTRKLSDNIIYCCPAAKDTYPDGKIMRTCGMNAQNILTTDPMLLARNSQPAQTLFIIDTKSKGDVDGYPYFRWNSNPRFADWVDARHDGKFSGLFLDGHVEMLNPSDPKVSNYINNFGN